MNWPIVVLLVIGSLSALGILYFSSQNNSIQASEEPVQKTSLIETPTKCPRISNIGSVSVSTRPVQSEPLSNLKLFLGTISNRNKIIIGVVAAVVIVSIIISLSLRFTIFKVPDNDQGPGAIGPDVEEPHHDDSDHGSSPTETEQSAFQKYLTNASPWRWVAVIGICVAIILFFAVAIAKTCSQKQPNFSVPMADDRSVCEKLKDWVTLHIVPILVTASAITSSLLVALLYIFVPEVSCFFFALGSMPVFGAMVVLLIVVLILALVVYVYYSIFEQNDENDTLFARFSDSVSTLAKINSDPEFVIKSLIVIACIVATVVEFWLTSYWYLFLLALIPALLIFFFNRIRDLLRGNPPEDDDTKF